MIRLLIEFIVPLLLPTALYGLWVAWSRRRDAAGGTGVPADWRTAPWIWLVGTGMALALAAAIGTGLGTNQGDIKGTYVPPRVIDGKVVPGHVDPAPTR